MAYQKNTWNDHVVQNQRTYNVVSNEDGTKTLVPAFGEVIQQGTPVDAEHLNHMEDGIETAQQGVDELTEWKQDMDTDANVQAAEEMLEAVQQALEDIQTAIESVPDTWQDALKEKADLDDVYPEKEVSGSLLVLTDAEPLAAAAVVSDYGGNTPKVTACGKNMWSGSATGSVSAASKTVGMSLAEPIPPGDFRLFFHYAGARSSITLMISCSGFYVFQKAIYPPAGVSSIDSDYNIPFTIPSGKSLLSISLTFTSLADEDTGTVSNMMLMPASVKDVTYEAYSGNTYTATGTPATAEPTLKSGLCVVWASYGSMALTYRTEKYQTKAEGSAEHTALHGEIADVAEDVGTLTDVTMQAISEQVTPATGTLLIVDDAVEHNALTAFMETIPQQESGTISPSSVRNFIPFADSFISFARTGVNMLKPTIVNQLYIYARSTATYTEFQLPQSIPAGRYYIKFNYLFTNQNNISETLRVKLGSTSVLSKTSTSEVLGGEVFSMVNLTKAAAAVYVSLEGADDTQYAMLNSFALFPASLGKGADTSNYAMERIAGSVPEDAGTFYVAQLDAVAKKLYIPTQAAESLSPFAQIAKIDGKTQIKFHNGNSSVGGYKLYGCDSYKMVAYSDSMANNTCAEKDNYIYIQDSRFTDLETAKSILESLDPKFLRVKTYGTNYRKVYDMPELPDMHLEYGRNIIFCAYGNITLTYNASKIMPTALKSMISLELKSTYPSEDIQKGRFFIMNNKAYVATAYLMQGYEIIPGTNCEEIPLGARFDGTGAWAFRENLEVTANGANCHAEGSGTTASTTAAHAEGLNTNASNQAAHAEGSGATASGADAHAEGSNTEASMNHAHAEGSGTKASNLCAHAEGHSTVASGYYSHAENDSTEASGMAAHADGYYTKANHRSQHVFGEFNTADASEAAATQRGNYVEIVGNGTGGAARSNARTLDWNGNEKLAGSLTLGMGTDDETTITAAQLKALLDVEIATVQEVKTYLGIT